MGEGVPSVGYVGVFDVLGLGGLMAKDLGGPAVQSGMGQFMSLSEEVV